MRHDRVMQVRLIQMPYRGERRGVECSPAPALVADDSLDVKLERVCGTSAQSVEVRLTPKEEREYGEWHRMGLANAHLATAVSDARSDDMFAIGLLANCNALPGMLAGLQHRGNDQAPRRIGLIWIDAHADFNTPETTPSGMLGGMPVAMSAGLCLHRLRQASGMIEPISTDDIVMSGLRDVDPLEDDLLSEHRIARIVVDDLSCDRQTPGRDALDRLFFQTDAVYVHIDMDVLDPAEVPGHPLTVPGGPLSTHLASLLHGLITYAKGRVEALGIASVPPPDDEGRHPEKAAAHRLIIAAAQAAFGDAGRS